MYFMLVNIRFDVRYGDIIYFIRFLPNNHPTIIKFFLPLMFSGRLLFKKIILLKVKQAGHSEKTVNPEKYLICPLFCPLFFCGLSAEPFVVCGRF